MLLISEIICILMRIASTLKRILLFCYSIRYTHFHRKNISSDCYCYEQKTNLNFFYMKLIHTRTNQFRRDQYNRTQVYEFGVFYDTYVISRRKTWAKLQYNYHNYQWIKPRTKLRYCYQLKDSFSFHLMSLIVNNSLHIKHVIPLLNYDNCLHYNHTKFGLNHFAKYERSYHKKQNMPILNRIYDILIWNYSFNKSVEFTFRLGSNRMYIDVNNFYNGIDFANQNLINMIYKIAEHSRKLEEKLTFAVIYNLFLR